MGMIPLAIRLQLTTVLLLLGAGSALGAGSPAVYEVRSGDNLSVIGVRFGVTVKDLKRANGLTSDLLSIGQELIIEKPFRRTRHDDVRWVRPSNRLGRVLRPYGQYKKGSVLMPRTGVDLVRTALDRAHPYEEVAYDLYPLENAYPRAGSGMLGWLDHEMEEEMFLNFLKDRLGDLGAIEIGNT